MCGIHYTCIYAYGCGSSFECVNEENLNPHIKAIYIHTHTAGLIDTRHTPYRVIQWILYVSFGISYYTYCKYLPTYIYKTQKYLHVDCGNEYIYIEIGCSVLNRTFRLCRKILIKTIIIIILGKYENSVWVLHFADIMYKRCTYYKQHMHKCAKRIMPHIVLSAF